jgi:hypothetical protein
LRAEASFTPLLVLGAFFVAGFAFAEAALLLGTVFSLVTVLPVLFEAVGCVLVADFGLLEGPAAAARAPRGGGSVSARACGMATGLHTWSMFVAGRPQFLQ